MRMLRANMVAEVQFIGSPGECLQLSALCARACTVIRLFTVLQLGRRTATPTRLRVGRDRRVCTLLPIGYFPLCGGGSVGGAVSWARACCSQCVLGARYLRSLKHLSFSGRCPAAVARPAVARSSRACIIVYMLYFRIRRRLTSCRLYASHAATK